MTRAVLANLRHGQWLLASIIDRVLHYWGHVPALDGGTGDHDHDNRLCPCSHQASSCARLLPRGSLLPLFWCFGATWSLTLSSKTVACPARSFEDMLALERSTSALRGNSLSQTNRGSRDRKCVRFLQDLVAAAVLLLFNADFPLQLLDFAHAWSERRDNDIQFFLKNRSRWAYEPRYTRPIPDLLAAIVGLLARRQLTTHRRCTQHGQFSKLHVQSFTSWILEVLNCELATPTPAAWIEIFERRPSLWEEQQLQLPHRPQIPASPPIAFADGAHLIAETGVQKFHGQSNWSLRLVQNPRLLGLSGTGCGTLVTSQWPIAPSAVTQSSTRPFATEVCLATRTILPLTLLIPSQTKKKNSPKKYMKWCCPIQRGVQRCDG